MGSIHYSADFQCPDTGFGVRLIWDSETTLIQAETCDSGIWDHSDASPELMETVKATDDWCEQFNCRQRKFDTLDDVNDFAEKYDTWF